jgi:hypothetical protein
MDGSAAQRLAGDVASDCDGWVYITDEKQGAGFVVHAGASGDRCGGDLRGTVSAVCDQSRRKRLVFQQSKGSV